MWNERYQTEEFVYGQNPNDFLAFAIKQIKPEGRLLSLGEGEGRNAIFLAKSGFDVTALDLSEVGLAKALRLAEKEGVSIQTIVADLSIHTIPAESYDVVVSIFCHLPPNLQKLVNAEIVNALKPGGFLILEGFSKEQLAFNSGGPRSSEMLMDLDEMLDQLSGLSFVIARKFERQLSEGALHQGPCSVIQVLAYKEAI